MEKNTKIKFIYGISVKEFIATEKLKSKRKLKNKYFKVSRQLHYSEVTIWT